MAANKTGLIFCAKYDMIVTVDGVRVQRGGVAVVYAFYDSTQQLDSACKHSLLW
jgi:hypothetical protein